MSNVRKKLRGFLRSIRAVAALEYAILVGVIAVGIVTALGTFSDQIVAAITRVTASITGILPATP